MIFCRLLYSLRLELEKVLNFFIFTELTLYIFLNKSVHNPEDANKSETLNYYILLILTGHYRKIYKIARLKFIFKLNSDKLKLA